MIYLSTEIRLYNCL